MRRSSPKHSTKDFIKAMGIAGLVIGAIAALFIVKIDSKPVLTHLTDLLTTSDDVVRTNAKESQMDRYTKEESEGLDKLIKEKSK